MTKPDDDEDAPHEYASPACFMHEVDPAYFGLPSPQKNKAVRDAESAIKDESPQTRTDAEDS